MMIAVTGATGAIGRRVAERLAARGIEQRLVVREAARAPSLPRAEIAVASCYADARALGRALAGVQTLFLVSARDLMGVIHGSLMSGKSVPMYDRVQQHVAAVAAAKAVGVKRIVYLSFVGAASDATFILARDHFHTEQYIRSTGVAFTFLRPNLYMDKVPELVAAADVIRAPAGDGRVAWVARDDVADAAVSVLMEEGHEGQVYELTGPEALTMTETAERLTLALERSITYEDQFPEQARRARNASRMQEMEAARRERTGRGLTAEEVEIWVSHYRQIAAGDLSHVSDAVPRLCGRPAESLMEYLMRWRRSQSERVSS